MNEEEVYRIMRAPRYVDQIVLEDGCYDIWFYVTRGTVLDQSQLVQKNLTPVVFQDGFFVATGYDYYKSLIKKRDRASGERGGAKKAPTPKKEIENKSLEKALDTPTAPPGAVPANKPLSMSMCSKPRQLQAPPPEPEEESDEIDIDSDDRRMLDDEREEDFNQW
jgi:hypothetical protein